MQMMYHPYTHVYIHIYIHINLIRPPAQGGRSARLQHKSARTPGQSPPHADHQRLFKSPTQFGCGILLTSIKIYEHRWKSMPWQEGTVLKSIKILITPASTPNIGFGGFNDRLQSVAPRHANQ